MRSRGYDMHGGFMICMARAMICIPGDCFFLAGGRISLAGLQFARQKLHLHGMGTDLFRRGYV